MIKLKYEFILGEDINMTTIKFGPIFFETGQLATLERETKKIRGVTSLGKQ